MDDFERAISLHGDKLITANDAQSVLYCVRGMRLFAEQQGLDFRKFVKQGITVKELLSTGDAMALEVVRIKYGL